MDKDQLHKLEVETSKIVREAGKYILDSWHNIKTKSYHDGRDLVTNIDVEVENVIREKLHLLVPDAGFKVEEGKDDIKPIYNWIIDPIDGTKDYALGSPLFYTMLSLEYHNIPVLGQIYNPVSRQLFSASTGNGCKLDGKIILAKTQSDNSKAIIDLDYFLVKSAQSDRLKLFQLLAQNFYRVRLSGGRFAPYLTTGSIDAHIHFDIDSKSMIDMSSRIIIYREAGLVVETFVLKDSSSIIVSTNAIVMDVIKRLLNDNNFLLL